MFADDPVFVGFLLVLWFAWGIAIAHGRLRAFRAHLQREAEREAERTLAWGAFHEEDTRQMLDGVEALRLEYAALVIWDRKARMAGLDAAWLTPESAPMPPWEAPQGYVELQQFGGATFRLPVRTPVVRTMNPVGGAKDSGYFGKYLDTRGGIE